MARGLTFRSVLAALAVLAALRPFLPPFLTAMLLCAACASSSSSPPPSIATGGATGNSGTGGMPGAGGASVPGWRLVWSDEFEGASGAAVDASKWKFDLGNNNGWGNSELENYTSGTANAALDGGGNLVITARKEMLGGQSYTSARLLTQGKATWAYGRVEARMKIPAGQGMWPAFWMLGDNITTVSWPTCGEIDIMENIGREPAIVHGTMHGPGYSGANGIGGPSTLAGSGGFADAFHMFAIEWERNVIRWYVDGSLYFTTTPASIPAGTTWVYDHPFFIIMNVAVGGGWPGNPDGTTLFPQTMIIDYVRVYQR